MKAEEFTFWLQGALEMNPEMLEKGMTPEQVQTIQDHLDLVFKKVTPNRFKKEKEIIPSPLSPYSPTDILNPGPIALIKTENDKYCHTAVIC